MKAYNLQLALKDPEKFTELYLHNRGISIFPMEVFVFENLKKLDLSQNRIEIIPPEIISFKSLESLILSGNQLKSLSVQLSFLSLLKELDLNDNPLSEIPKVIFDLKKLRILRLSNTKIEKIDPELERCSELEYFDISNNNVSSLPKEIGKLTSLKKIFLQKNNLQKLPKDLVNCNQLVSLDTSFNRLNNLPEDFGNLGKLEILNIQHNRLASLPESIGDCTFLRTLNIGFNKIQSLPERIIQLKQLRILDCSKNKIIRLPDNIGACVSLRHLFLSKNLLNKLPKSMSTLHSLETLDITENQVAKLPDTFQYMVRLKTLELKNNKLESLPDSLKKLKSLQYLGLVNNPITIHPEELLKLENLEKLSGQIGIDPPKKRKLLQFLKSCKKQKVTNDLRISFYRLMNGTQSKIPLNILLKALSFHNKNIQQNALNSIIKNYSQQHELKEGAVLSFAGKSHFKVEEITPILLKAGIRIELKLSEKTTHLVLGFNAPYCEMLLKNKFTFLTERELNTFIKIIRAETPNQLVPDEIEKVGALLTSNRPENTEIALQVLKRLNNYESILTELFIAYKFATDKKQKAKLRSMLELNLPERAAKLLNLPLGISGQIDKNRLDRTIKKLNEAGFDGKKITYFINKKESR